MTRLILIITSYPIALVRCGLREAGGNAHASLLITGTVIMWHVSGCVPGVLSIYMCVRVRVRAFVRACVRARARVRVRVCVCFFR